MSYVTAEDIERYHNEAEGLTELIQNATAECDEEKDGDFLKLLAAKHPEIKSLLTAYQNDLAELERAQDKLSASQDRLLKVLYDMLDKVEEIPDLLARDHILTVAAHPRERKAEPRDFG